MSIFQILSVLFSLLMLYIISIHKKKAALSNLEMMWWGMLWTSFIIAALFPRTLSSVTEILQFARIFDLLLIGALMVLTILVFISYLTIRTYSAKLDKLTRSIAFKNAKHASTTKSIQLNSKN